MAAPRASPGAGARPVLSRIMVLPKLKYSKVDTMSAKQKVAHRRLKGDFMTHHEIARVVRKVSVRLNISILLMAPDKAGP
jgi:hypothetical protein